jgi:hypothetical protein
MADRDLLEVLRSAIRARIATDHLLAILAGIQEPVDLRGEELAQALRQSRADANP